jgi:hypothetical protein
VEKDAGRKNSLVKILLTGICVLIGAMWVYAFGFAPRESINRIGDEAWMARSEARCLVAENERFAMENLDPLDPTNREDLNKKADIVTIATDSLEAAIDDIEADVPNDPKGQAIVPEWIREYRIYIEDRRDFAEALRTADRRPYFAETEIEGVPISERLGKFARENDMRTCQPPLDLSV